MRTWGHESGVGGRDVQASSTIPSGHLDPFGKLAAGCTSPGGGTGRRRGLKILWAGRPVRVRVPPRAPRDQPRGVQGGGAGSAGSCGCTNERRFRPRWKAAAKVSGIGFYRKSRSSPEEAAAPATLGRLPESNFSCPFCCNSISSLSSPRQRLFSALK